MKLRLLLLAGAGALFPAATGLSSANAAAQPPAVSGAFAPPTGPVTMTRTLVRKLKLSVNALTRACFRHGLMPGE